MKKYVVFILAIAIGLLAVSCTKQYETYEQYVVRNGIEYPQAAENLTVEAGYYRARLTWSKAIDPSVNEAIVYWHGKNDSTIVNLNDNTKDVELIIDNLEEDNQTFVVVTVDSNDNRSIPVESSVLIIGKEYLNSLVARSVSSLKVNSNSAVEIVWGNKTSKLIWTELQYKAVDGSLKTLKVGLNDKTTIIDDMDFTDPDCLKYRSVFFVDSCFDYLYKDWVNAASLLK